MTYYILFMCFPGALLSNIDGTCSSAQFPDVKQCLYSMEKIKKVAQPRKIWCQEVRK